MSENRAKSATLNVTIWATPWVLITATKRVSCTLSANDTARNQEGFPDLIRGGTFAQYVEEFFELGEFVLNFLNRESEAIA